MFPASKSMLNHRLLRSGEGASCCLAQGDGYKSDVPSAHKPIVASHHPGMEARLHLPVSRHTQFQECCLVLCHLQAFARAAFPTLSTLCGL